MKYKLEDIKTVPSIRFFYVTLTKYTIFVTFICKKKKKQKSKLTIRHSVQCLEDSEVQHMLTVIIITLILLRRNFP